MVTPLFWNGFSAITSLFFIADRKEWHFWNQWIFLRVSVCKFSIFVMSRDHFSTPFMGLYLPNAWSQTLQTSKRHTFRVSAFHRCHWFGLKKNFLQAVCRIVEGTIKTRKNAVLDLTPLTLQNSGIFHDTTRPHIHFFAAIRRLYIGLRVRYKYYKNIVVLVWPGAAHAPIAVWVSPQVYCGKQ